MKWLILLIILPTLIGCASTSPRNKNDACLMLAEKGEWKAPLLKASVRWEIPKHTILSIIYHESKFVSDAKPPRKKIFGISMPFRRISSAYGYPQALDGTWEEYKKKRGKSYAERTNFEDSVDFIGWYLNRSVRELGISRHDAYYLYLAYHQGNKGFRKKAYLRKPRIMSYAKKVRRTALVYKKQIRSCS
jgi:hypothetical protein